MLPLGGGRLCILIVFYGHQGDDRDPERLALSDQLLDAGLGELGVVACEQPVCWLEISMWSPPRFLAWQKGRWLGSGFDLEASWASASGSVSWFYLQAGLGVSFGVPAGFHGGLPSCCCCCLWMWALQDRRVVPHFPVRACFDYSRWFAKVSLPVQRTPLWPASGYRYLIRGRVSKTAEVQRVWDIYDDRLQFMSLFLEALRGGSVLEGLRSWIQSMWTRDGCIPQGCPLSMMFIVALYLPWCGYLGAQVGVQPLLYADNLECVSRDSGVLLRAARFATGYVRMVGQEPAPSKCVLMSTSRSVRNTMRGWGCF